MNIIIVDDDSLVAGALKTILEINEDINVAATGSDGLEACELYRKYQPDILLIHPHEKYVRSGSLHRDPAGISAGKHPASYYILR